MTTIACNKKSLACDLQATGNYKFKLKTKAIVAEKNGYTDRFNTEKLVLGAAGALQELCDVWPFVFDPTGKVPKTRNVTYLMLTKEKKLMHSENFVNWVNIDQPFFSIGSGSPYAMTAMELGKTPIEACRIASKYDPGTGMGYKQFVL